MSSLTRVLLAVALAIAGQPAVAQEASSVFLVEQGHWWISRMASGSCIAHNRPLAEFNAVPFNSVALQQEIGAEQPRLQAIFWPDSFEAGQELNLLIVPSSGKPFQYPAKADTDYHVTGIAPLTEAEFDRLTASTTVTLGGEATPQSLVIEVRELAQVELWLDACARPQPTGSIGQAGASTGAAATQ